MNLRGAARWIGPRLVALGLLALLVYFLSLAFPNGMPLWAMYLMVNGAD